MKLTDLKLLRIENERIEAEKKAAREADTENKKAVNNAAMAAFVNLGLSPSAAKCAVKGIAMSLIPGVKIEY